MASLVRINDRQLPAVFRSFHTDRIFSLLLPSCCEISARIDFSSYSANHLRMLLAVRFQESMDDWRLESDRLDSVIDIDEREWERANAIAPGGVWQATSDAARSALVAREAFPADTLRSTFQPATERQNSFGRDRKKNRAS